MTLRVDPARIVAESRNPLLQIAPKWNRVRLGDVAQIVNGFAFPSADFSRDHGMPLIRIRDITKHSTEACYRGSYDPRYVVERGALLVGMDGDFNVAEWSGPEGLLNQRVCRVAVRDEAEYSQRFLRWVLPGYLTEIHAHTSAVTVKHLSSVTLGDLPIPLPPRPEQDRIVVKIEEEFSRIDAAVTGLSRARARCVNCTASAVDAYVGQDAGPAVELGDVLDRVEAGRSFRCQARPSRLDEWGVVKVSAMTWGHFDPEENKAVVDARQVNPAFEIFEGDLLFSRANTVEYVGAVVLVSDVRPRLLLSDKSLRLIPRGDLVLATWLLHALRSRFARRQIESYATGTKDSMRNISQGNLRRVKIPLPPLAAQHRLVEVLERNLNTIHDVQSEVSRCIVGSRHLRAAILSRALMGGLASPEAAA